MKPVNLSSVIPVMFAATAEMQKCMADGQITVSEAIDIFCKMAHEAANQAGVADNPVATLR